MMNRCATLTADGGSGRLGRMKNLGETCRGFEGRGYDNIEGLSRDEGVALLFQNALFLQNCVRIIRYSQSSD